jgi:hypothetical protein
MQTLDDTPETIHLYVVREQVRPSLAPIILSAVFLASLVALAIAIPYQQPVSRAVIRVPAVPLAIRTFTSMAAVIPTGVRTYPATTAHGVLTITNGSIIGQSIPAGFTVQGVAIDDAVYVPGGSANGYGWAQVSAHALRAGKTGNLPALAINSVIGSSVYVRNMSAFSGGRDSYAVKVVTAQDKQVALTKARNALNIQSSGLHYPCSEHISGTLMVNWRCQFLTYHIPAFYYVTGVRIIGKSLLLSIWFIPHPIRFWVK